MAGVVGWLNIHILCKKLDFLTAMLSIESRRTIK